MKLSIIIPVYNEKHTILKLINLIEDVDLHDIEKEIIIVDDLSADGTREIIENLRHKYKVILKEKNEGKGSALILGYLAATGDIIINQDADLEYDPNEYADVIKPIIDDKADVVLGSRFVGNHPKRVMYYWHYVGNKILTTFSNILSNINLTDMEACYKAFNRKSLDHIKHKLTSKRFGIEPEILALVAKGKFRIYEVGISYFGRTYQEGKKINWKDGFAAFYHIVKYNIFR